MNIASDPGNVDYRKQLAKELIRLGFPERARLILNALNDESNMTPSQKYEKKLLEDVLLGKHGPEWALTGVGEGARVEYNGGMAEGLVVDAARFADSGAAMLQRAPIQMLDLRNATPKLVEKIAKAGLLARITDLRLIDCIGCQDVVAALENHAPNLKRLGLRGAELADSEVDGLAKSPLIARLTALDLGDNYLTESGVKKLLDARGSAPLLSLNLDGNVLGPNTLPKLLQHPALGKLRSLSLRGTWGANGETLAGLLKSLPELETLDVSNNKFTNSDLAALASLPSLGNVRHLKLSNINGATAEGWKALAGATWMSSVRRLDLSHNPTLEKEGVSRLMAASKGGLVELDLSNCNLNDDAVTPLFAEGAMPKVLRLDLSYNQLTAESARALVAKPNLRSLLSLNLSGNKIGNSGLATLVNASKTDSAGSRNFNLPPSLILTSTGITTAGLKGLLASPQAGDIRELGLSQLMLGADGLDLIELIAKRNPSVPLKIALHGTSLGDGVQARKRLEELNRRHANLFLDY